MHGGADAADTVVQQPHRGEIAVGQHLSEVSRASIVAGHSDMTRGSQIEQTRAFSPLERHEIVKRSEGVTLG